VSHGQSAQEPQSLTGTSDHGADHEVVTTLFDLERQVTAVLDLEELLHQIPRLIARLISFEAFAVYLLDERKGELRVAYSIGYPLSDATRNGWEKEVRFAQRVQAALLPAGPPKRLKGVDIAAAFASTRELAATFTTISRPNHTLVVAVRRCPRSSSCGREPVPAVPSLPALEIEIGLLNVQSDCLTAEGRNFVDASLDSYARPLRWHAAILRHDRHLARPIIDLVKPERHERHAPGVRDHPIDRDGFVLIPARIVFELRDTRPARGERAAGQQDDNSEWSGKTANDSRH
jgi:hypothetical protein